MIFDRVTGTVSTTEGPGDHGDEGPPSIALRPSSTIDPETKPEALQCQRSDQHHGSSVEGLAWGRHVSPSKPRIKCLGM
jgi:hypothetical protein